MDQRQHQNQIKLTLRTGEKREALAVAPADGRTGHGEVLDQGQDRETLGPRSPA